MNPHFRMILYCGPSLLNTAIAIFFVQSTIICKVEWTSIVCLLMYFEYIYEHECVCVCVLYYKIRAIEW